MTLAYDACIGLFTGPQYTFYRVKFCAQEFDFEFIELFEKSVFGGLNMKIKAFVNLGSNFLVYKGFGYVEGTDLVYIIFCSGFTCIQFGERIFFSTIVQTTNEGSLELVSVPSYFQISELLGLNCKLRSLIFSLTVSGINSSGKASSMSLLYFQ